MTDTSSPTVIPALTKTDARELKSLVRTDTKILLDQLDHRAAEFLRQIRDSERVEYEAIQAERNERDEVDRNSSQAVLRKIQRRIDTVNKFIVDTMTGLADDGWTGYNGSTFDPHSFTVAFPSPDHLRPADRDDSDLDERFVTLRANSQTITDSVSDQHEDAQRELQTNEASVTRDLTLQSITTEKAQEFILDMPDVENLLPTPATLVGIEA